MLGDETVFKQLIGLGAEITENKFGHSVVHTAAYHNNLDVLEYFLKENENKTSRIGSWVSSFFTASSSLKSLFIFIRVFGSPDICRRPDTSALRC
jgi:hypothetical protein